MEVNDKLVFCHGGNKYVTIKELQIKEFILKPLLELSGANTNWLRRSLYANKSHLLLDCLFNLEDPKVDILIEEIRYLRGSELSGRYSHMIVFEYSHFIIPGLFLVSGAPTDFCCDNLVSQGFKCFISLMEPEQELEKGITYGNRYRYTGDFDIEKDGIQYCRYAIIDRKTATDEKAMTIATLILNNITKKIPTVLHCFGGKGRAGTIASIVVGLLYHLPSQECLDIVGDLFKNRENKGTKCKKMPQTNCQFEQVKRLVVKPNWYTL